ncbi:MAG: response regulator [Desulfobacterales bacterium]|nr:response regulator [Desulfobacterales bacterium]
MNKTILLVDDEEGIRKVLSISLSDSGYKVYTAQNGEDALQILRNTNTPIVITDIKMPGMDGIELLKTIKSEKPETEVIMITGHGDIDLAIRSLKFEAIDFVTKPINDDALEIALKRAYERIDMRLKLKEYTENLESLVEQKTKQLIESERMAAIGQTIAGLSHAIKNIASGLKGGSFVLEKGLELDNKTYLFQGWEMIKGNVEKIKNLSLNLLNYGKFRTINYRLFDPNKIVHEVSNLMIQKAKDNGITFKLDLDTNLSEIFMDPEGMQLCILNLLTNSIDACIENSLCNSQKEIIIKTSKHDLWAVEYRVIDKCGGIDDDIKNKIFNGFFTTKGTQGTGIGLMLTKKIIDEHKGVIEILSEKGHGSEFIIKLPNYKAAE